jgi:hypothetical protein
MVANTVDTTATLEYAAENIVDDSHKHYDVGYKFAFAEIASLFEEIRDDMRIIKDRLDDRQKGFHVREADVVAGNPANIAMQAGMVAALRDSGLEAVINQEIQNPTNFGNTSTGSYGGVTNTGAPGGMVGSNQPRTTGFAGSSTVTNPSTGQTVPLDQAELDALTPTSSNAEGRVTVNPSGSRTLGIRPELLEILQTAAQAAGVDVLVTSGGQVPADRGGRNGVNRTGSNRHDLGYAADVVITDADGNRQRVNAGPEELGVVVKFLEACRDAGATGIGAGNGYMSDSVYHVDIAWEGQKKGDISGILSNRYWGGGSSRGLRTSTANTPRWLVQLMAPRDNT